MRILVQSYRANDDINIYVRAASIHYAVHAYLILRHMRTTRFLVVLPSPYST